MSVLNFSDIIYMSDLVCAFENSNRMVNDEFDEDSCDFFKNIFDQIEGTNSEFEYFEWQNKKYPDRLIRDTYFVEYIKSHAKEIFKFFDLESWPFNCIDWEKAAHQIKLDYRFVKIDGMIYWYVNK